MKRSRPLSLIPAASAAILLLLMTTLALAGCSTGEQQSEQPAKPPTTTAPSKASAPAIGMDLRYLDDDGTVKTIRTEDLNR